VSDLDARVVEARAAPRPSRAPATRAMVAMVARDGRARAARGRRGAWRGAQTASTTHPCTPRRRRVERRDARWRHHGATMKDTVRTTVFAHDAQSARRAPRAVSCACCACASDAAQEKVAGSFLFL